MIRYRKIGGVQDIDFKARVSGHGMDGTSGGVEIGSEIGLTTWGKPGCVIVSTIGAIGGFFSAIFE